MTRDEILALKPGPELDALVAEKVMGYTTHGQFREKNGVRVMIDRYSADLSAVWEVEEEIERQNKRVAYCQALKIVLYSKDEYVGMFDYVHASPADRCKAALLAVMEG